jgi:2',3'-cyclic-nucleotide 2'-phosphodiesterase/3'-nucleotidase
MKRIRALSLIAIVATFVSACAGVNAYREVGSLDRTRVELLSNGKAKVVDILSLNDFHAALLEDLTFVESGVIVEGKNPGMAKLATAAKDFARVNPNTVFVSAGDHYQGSALGVITRGKIVSEFFKDLGVSASAVGNHEFDWGDGFFQQWTEEGGFPFVAANIVEKDTGKTPSWAKPYEIVKVGGHTVAFIGLATMETLNTVKAENVAKYEFIEPAAALRKWVVYLEKTEKPEAIIALTHIPTAMDKVDPTRVIPASTLNEIDAVCLVPGVDAVITGHSHQKVNGRNNGVPVVQGYYNGRGFARVTLTFSDSGSVSVNTGYVDVTAQKASLVEDPEARAIYDRYMVEHGPALLEKVATVDGDLWHERTRNVSPMGYWVCETLRSVFDADVAVMNGGGLRKGFTPGMKTVQDFWDLMPFDNTAVVFDVSGRDLRAIIDHGIDAPSFGHGQFSGIIVTYDPLRPWENKIVSMKLADGTPITDEGVYTVVTNDFIFLTGGDGYTMMLKAAKNVVETFVPIRDVLIDEARKAGRIVATEPRVLIAK